MFTQKTYRKRDGTISSFTVKSPMGSTSYNPNGSFKGSSSKLGNVTTYTDGSFKPKKYKMKVGNQSFYYNKNMDPLGLP